MPETKTIMGREISREEFEEMKKMMAGGMGEKMEEAMNAFGALGGDGSLETKVLDVPLPADAQEPAVKAALERVRFGIADTWFGKLRVEVDLFWVPNPEMLKVAIEPGAGTTLGDEGSLDSKKLVYTFEVPGPEGADDDRLRTFAETVRVTTRLTAAASVKALVFKAADLGKEREGWTLVKMEKNHVTLRRPTGPDDAVIAALDSGGRRLDWQSTGQETAHISGKPPWELEWDDLSAEKFSSTYTASYHGVPAEVRVYRPIKSVTAACPLKLVFEPKMGDEGPPAGVRFAPARERKWVEFSEKQAREQISVRFDRNAALMEAGQPEVNIHLPSADNSAFATVEVEDLVLSGDAGDLAGYEVVNGGFRYDPYLEQRRFTGEGGDMKFEALRRIRGTAIVQYPLRVQMIRARKTGAAGPVQVELDGSRVSVGYDPAKVPGLEASLSGFPPDDLDRIVARHESGLMLRRLRREGSFSSGEETRRELHFWGPVGEVEVRIPTDYVEIRVPIDVKAQAT